MQSKPANQKQKVKSIEIRFPFCRLRYPRNGFREAERTVLETHFGFDSLFPKGIKLDGKKIGLSHFRKDPPFTLYSVPSFGPPGEQAAIPDHCLRSVAGNRVNVLIDGRGEKQLRVMCSINFESLMQVAPFVSGGKWRVDSHSSPRPEPAGSPATVSVRQRLVIKTPTAIGQCRHTDANQTQRHPE